MASRRDYCPPVRDLRTIVPRDFTMAVFEKGQDHFTFSNSSDKRKSDDLKEVEKDLTGHSNKNKSAQPKTTTAVSHYFYALPNLKTLT